MIWYILISLLILLFTWLLLGPVILRVNTDLNRYQLMLPGVLNARVEPSEGLPALRGWILFVPFRFDLSKLSKGREKKRKKRDRKKRKGWSKKKGMSLIRSIPRAFRIKRLMLDLDTENFILNAWLVPAFSALNSQQNIHMQVNFEGILFMDLDLRTRMGALLWIAIKNR